MHNNEDKPIYNKWKEDKVKHAEIDITLVKLADGTYKTYDKDALDADRVYPRPSNISVINNSWCIHFQEDEINHYLPKLIRAGRRVHIISFNNNNSNQLTTMTTYNLTINDNKVYLFIGGALQAFKPIKVEYSNNDGYTLIAEIGGKLTTLDQQKSLPMAYASEEDYRKGNAVAMHEFFAGVRYANFINPNDEWNEVWYVDGKHIFNFEYEDMPKTVDYTTKKYYIGDTDRQHYATRELLMMCEDIDVIDEQGNKTLSKSLFNRIALTAEQEKVWKKYLQVCEELRANHISIVCDDNAGLAYPIGGDELTVDWEICDRDTTHEVAIPSDTFMALMPHEKFFAHALYCSLPDCEEVYLRPYKQASED